MQEQRPTSNAPYRPGKINKTYGSHQEPGLRITACAHQSHYPEARSRGASGGAKAISQRAIRHQLLLRLLEHTSARAVFNGQYWNTSAGFFFQLPRAPHSARISPAARPSRPAPPSIQNRAKQAYKRPGAERSAQSLGKIAMVTRMGCGSA